MKLIKTFLVFVMVGIIVYSCGKSFLDKPALGSLDEEAIANRKGVENLLIGAYSLLDGMGSKKSGFGSATSNWMYGSVCGSEAYTGSVPGDADDIGAIERFSITAGNNYIDSKWGTVYDGVQRANDVLRVMKKAIDISPQDQQRIAAEARFLRAHYHFEAKKMWSRIPFIDETITYGNGNFHVSNDGDAWPRIEADLVFAAENLAETPYLNAVGRANKYTAKALLAKAYLFQQSFGKAKPLLAEIINSGRYQLDSNFHDNFNPETRNSKESIFSVQMSVNDGAGGANGNYGDLLNFPFIDGAGTSCCSFFQPSQFLVNHFKTDVLTGLPDLERFNSTNPVTNDEGIESGDPSFKPYSGTLDPRIDWTVGRRGIPYLDWGLHPGKDWIRDHEFGGPYSPKKNVYYKSQQGRLTDLSFWSNGITANNVNLIRFADVLLWAAEVEVEIGSLTQAQEYVNRIRERAANPLGWVHTYVDPPHPSQGFTNTAAANYKINKYPPGYFAGMGKAFARRAVQYERMLELAMEGHRFFDLVRWGIADAEINMYLTTEKVKRKHLSNVVFTKGCHEYFPIPRIQIDLSAGVDGAPKMKQNPCY